MAVASKATYKMAVSSSPHATRAVNTTVKRAERTARRASSLGVSFQRRKGAMPIRTEIISAKGI